MLQHPVLADRAAVVKLVNLVLEEWLWTSQHSILL